MKTKIRLLVPFVLLFCGVAEAQQFRAGLTGGLLTSNIPGTGAGLIKAGFTGGFFVNTSISSNLVLQMEFNYIQKGAAQLPDSANNHSFKYTFDYVEVPILFRRHLHFTMFKKPATGFDLEFGASFARLFSYNFILNNYTQYLDATELNKTDVSLLFGLDYNFGPNLYLCLRYSNSVIPVLKRDATVSASQLFYTYNAGNNVDFQITLKYLFGSGGEAAKDSNKE